MGCKENEYLVNNADRPDWMRKEALDNLIRDACLESLWRLIDNSDRPDWMRNRALDALCAFAGFGVMATASNTSIAIAGDTINVNLVTISIHEIGSSASDFLYRLANNSDRPDRMRRQAVETLVAVRHADYCLRIADNSDRPDWMRKLAMKGL